MVLGLSIDTIPFLRRVVSMVCPSVRPHTSTKDVSTAAIRKLMFERNFSNTTHHFGIERYSKKHGLYNNICS